MSRRARLFPGRDGPGAESFWAALHWRGLESWALDCLNTKAPGSAGLYEGRQVLVNELGPAPEAVPVVGRSERYITERSPSLASFANVTLELAEREPWPARRYIEKSSPGSAISQGSWRVSPR
jgi:hypothetical protein